MSLQAPSTDATIPPTLSVAKKLMNQLLVAIIRAMNARGKAIAMPEVKPWMVPSCVTLQTQS